jgi:hypothetical protein
VKLILPEASTAPVVAPPTWADQTPDVEGNHDGIGSLNLDRVRLDGHTTWSATEGVVAWLDPSLYPAEGLTEVELRKLAAWATLAADRMAGL